MELVMAEGKRIKGRADSGEDTINRKGLNGGKAKALQAVGNPRQLRRWPEYLKNQGGFPIERKGQSKQGKTDGSSRSLGREQRGKFAEAE